MGIIAITLMIVTCILNSAIPIQGQLESYTECYYASDRSDYRGSVSVTTSGKTCQYWSSETPHKHPFLGLRMKHLTDLLFFTSNNCRNPNGIDDNGVWCYTTDAEVRWENCDIPEPEEACDNSTACEINAHCQNGGTCKSDGTCECTDSFSGIRCETRIGCNDDSYCSFNGVCLLGRCRCDDGYEGVHCQDVGDECPFLTSIPEICGRNGHCYFGQCECYEGYKGENCETKSVVIEPRNCESDFDCYHGSCNYYGNCDCQYGYSGPKCLTNDRTYNNDDDHYKKKGKNSGVIVGIVAGVFAFVFIVVTICIVVLKQYRGRPTPLVGNPVSNTVYLSGVQPTEDIHKGATTQPIPQGHSATNQQPTAPVYPPPMYPPPTYPPTSGSFAPPSAPLEPSHMATSGQPINDPSALPPPPSYNTAVTLPSQQATTGSASPAEV